MPPLHHVIELAHPLMESSESSSTMDISSLNAKLTKQVCFAPRVTVRRSLRRDDFTKEELESCWYKTSELKEIRSNLRTLVEDISNGDFEPQESDSFTLRGLETYLPEGLALKNTHRSASRDIVLDAQDYMWKRGIDDIELLADMYFDKTRSSVAMARMQGMSDEAEVQQPFCLFVPHKHLTSRAETRRTMTLRPAQVSSRAA